MTRSEYGKLKAKIEQWIEEIGTVPPIRDISERLNCSSTTAWRIVKSLGWEANYRHRWTRPEKN
ncbi:MAG: hypothetical protein HY022_11595 [Chloroflexi bacterium]|nr:hypothetical protein [Chloroflexota bacterium]